LKKVEDKMRIENHINETGALRIPYNHNDDYGDGGPAREDIGLDFQHDFYKRDFYGKTIDGYGRVVSIEIDESIGHNKSSGFRTIEVRDYSDYDMGKILNTMENQEFLDNN